MRMLARLMAVYPVRKALGPTLVTRAWRSLGADVAPGVYIGPRVWMRIPQHVSIGAGSNLSGRILLDSWGKIRIGQNVLMNGDVELRTAGHHVDSPTFDGDIGDITIGDFVWLPVHILVLPGVTIGECAVVGSGSVVTRDVPAHGVVAGNPARVIGERAHVRYRYVPSKL